MAMKSEQLKASLIAEIVSLETKDDLRRVFAAAKSRWSELEARASAEKRLVISAGTKVQWEGRRGFGTGVVEKVRVTKAVVKLDGSGVKYIIPLSMLVVRAKEA